MADNTKIEWTDATWNPITGCSVVSPGCTNCYAMKLAGTRLKHHPSRERLTKDTKAGPVWTGEVRFNAEWLDQPLRWKRPRMIFVCAHGDLFAEGVPDEWIDQVFAVMALSPQHVFQVLTKRPERMREYFAGRRSNFGRASDVLHEQISHGFDEDHQQDAVDRLDLFDSMGKPLANVWLGVSVEDQRRADERIPLLLDTPAAIRWISAEPLLGYIDLGQLQTDLPTNAWLTWLDSLDWVVAGGESGAGARPMHPHWAYALRDQCAAAGVPFHFKQWGNWAIASHENGHFESSMVTNDAVWLDIDGRQAKPSCNGMSEPIGMFRVPKSRSGRLLSGQQHDEFPPLPLPAHFQE
ncbi:phage Gp37/Gp68 family protein [Rhizobium sp. BK060]|uniref:phage Gp37/Gp68 family protein n=1 Tax=Rhizobium sp. BK060 TaxID=2587096 RepID=UPI001611F4C7|nr:phage Gp37/Gp68 family protein [Rhizobium sp. BK060]MBB3396845.1 protein gp37 [Rhizobium sp. BK060]